MKRFVNTAAPVGMITETETLFVADPCCTIKDVTTQPPMDLSFNESEWEWIERRAERIALETGGPLPFARAVAIEELKALRKRPKAEIIPLARRRAARQRAV